MPARKKKTRKKKSSGSAPVVRRAENARSAISIKRENTGLAESQIQASPGGLLRPLDPEHVVSLAESIGALAMRTGGPGLIQPVAVSRDRQLLAGAHRLAAVRLLLEDEGVRLSALDQMCPGELPMTILPRLHALPSVEEVGHLIEEVPVHTVETEDDSDLRMAIAIAENTQRRAFSSEEIRSLYQELLDAGFADGVGRNRADAPSAQKTLAAIVGVSQRTIQRRLKPPKNKAPKKKPKVKKVEDDAPTFDPGPPLPSPEDDGPVDAVARPGRAPVPTPPSQKDTPEEMTTPVVISPPAEGPVPAPGGLREEVGVVEMDRRQLVRALRQYLSHGDAVTADARHCCLDLLEELGEDVEALASE